MALDKRRVLLENLDGSSIRVVTGLSEAKPRNMLVLPIVFEGEAKGVLELASVECFSPSHQAFLDQLTESIGIVINTIKANMRTEDLLTQSQSLAKQLQSRGEELQQTNEELQDKAKLLAQRNQEVERKNNEVEQARQALEDKAIQLARTSKYKSEFLANMSHELRTPLNSLLILSDQLCQNRDGNLTGRQVEFAKTIHSSGNDLLTLINDILDLSKIESGTVNVDVSELRFDDLRHYVERTFRHVGESKDVDFLLRVDPRLPKSMVTDAKRLQQILKNLLSNAFKFTHEGQVTLSIEPAEAGWNADNEDLNRAAEAVAFHVTDTGIGISNEKQQIIFEAFQQADGSTSRKYGGTGLGLAISRELSQAAGRRDPAREHARPRLELHALSAARPTRRRACIAGIAPAGTSELGQADNGHVFDRRQGAGAAAAGADAARQRGDGRPRQHPAGRHRAADRRERSGLRALPARGRPREGLQGHWSPRRAPAPWRWRATTCRMPSRSTSCCPTWRAGA